MRKFKVILKYGLLWGILEATLAVFLKTAVFPVAGYIMTAIGISIMARAVVKHRMPYITPWIGFVAASVKLLDLFIYPVPLWGKVLRPAVAILMESLVFCFISVPVFYWHLKKKTASQRVESRE